MTAAPFFDPVQASNEAAFETCVFLSIRVLAGLEFCGDLYGTRMNHDVLVECAAELERHAGAVIHLDGNPGTDAAELGQSWFQRLASAGKKPLEIAYESLHAAAYLGLDGGTTSALMLGSAAFAMRVLSLEHGARLN
ncbi:hypothetical protein [Deinococcus ruber]|nr:hypothetical protein [Deinococcus ruber]